MNSEENKKDLNKLLKKLYGKICSGDAAAERAVLRELQEQPGRAVPVIEEELLRFSRSKIRSGDSFKIIVTLCYLLYDFDEERAKVVFEEILEKKLNPALNIKLEGLLSFKDAYQNYEIRSLPVLVHPSILKRVNLAPVLECWLENIPEKDLRNLKFIIFSIRGDIWSSESLIGLHTWWWSKAVITIAWNNSFPAFFPFSFLLLFCTEWIFYHELGHHVLKHTFLAKSYEEREKEADSYAWERLLEAHRYLVVVDKLGRQWARWLCIKVMTLSRWRSGKVESKKINEMRITDYQ